MLNGSHIACSMDPSILDSLVGEEAVDGAMDLSFDVFDDMLLGAAAASQHHDARGNHPVKISRDVRNKQGDNTLLIKLRHTLIQHPRTWTHTVIYLKVCMASSEIIETRLSS